ncbi:hypothetical protein [Almyronema epifaneia]|uniref:Ssl1498 family light-harvesting-like protein n=1 Tax=Almyronema epifaneia S1 TaxID=2991925 RepID=A0ABW6IES2_9CYAN
MKNMVWTPNAEKDQKANQYLEEINHAPYEVIFAMGIALFCLFTLIVLVGIF